MKTLFLTTRRPDAQGDYLELTLVHGLRELLGNDFVEFPKKKILYGDFSESPIENLHGKGFTLCTDIIQDTNYDISKLNVKDFDVVIHGSGHIYGDYWDVDHPFQVYVDGHDLYGNAPIMKYYMEHNIVDDLLDSNTVQIIGNQFPDKFCFKREMVEEFEKTFPIGFGIPLGKISYWHNNRTRLFQSTAPSDTCFYENSSYKFSNESSYYNDMRKSWFGLTCKKGGWDCLRHYEILASGAVLLFKDFNQKPKWCQPLNLPTISYHTKDELHSIMNRLVVDNIPTAEYLELQDKQQQWLFANGTTIARAKYMMAKIEEFKQI